MASVTVYGTPISPAVARVLACLYEKEVDFKLAPVDMAKGQHKSPDFLKIQPFGQVPAFQDELTTVFVPLVLPERNLKHKTTHMQCKQESIDFLLQQSSINPPDGTDTLLSQICETNNKQKQKTRMVGSLKVSGQPASTEVARVLTCLFEKDLLFQLIRIDSFRRQHRIPEFLQLQDPSGQVLFKEGDLILRDSREVIRHLCNKYPDHGNKKLYGNGSLEKASIEQWLQAESQNFGPPSSELVFHLAFAKPLGKEPNMAIIEENEKRLSHILDVYDQKLGKSEYLAGDEFTLADLSHLPSTHYLVTRCERGKKLFTERKNVARWVKDITGRDSWKKVIELQSEHPAALQK